MKKYIFWILFFVLAQQTIGQCSLNLNLKGKEYDSLSLIIRTDYKSHRIKGKSDDNKNWVFLYHDSIYNQHKQMEIEFLENDTSVHILSFCFAMNDQDTIKIGSFSLSKHSLINAFHIETEKQSKAPFVQFKDFIIDAFLVEQDSDEDLFLSSLALSNGYSMFDRSRDSLTYNERLEKYICFTTKNPSSHFLISMLHSTLSFYKNTADIMKIFHLFSNDKKNSYYGKKIQLFLKMNFFENSSLPTWNSPSVESIIEDSSKINLLVFSASWCGPCHKLIPVLKKMDNELHDKLNIVYISIDEPGTVDEWKQFMIKEQIPWRSLVAANDLKSIKDKYFIQSIPLAFLVSPDGKMERLKLYEENDIKKIYSAVNVY